MPEPYFVYGKKEIDWLKSRDPILGAAIDEIGHIKRPLIPDIFMALVNAIVGQQISTKAQATIWNRMLKQFSPFAPETIGEVSAEQLQTCGISMRKAVYIKEIARSILDGNLNLSQVKKLSDNEVCKCLVQVKGIGLWTAEMLMIFSMQRPDIISWNDLAILRGMCILYHHRKITPKLFAKYKRRYSPYSTTASLYLWAIAGGSLKKL
jgi:DNA-3-methyladenine glycosylase II